jgi:hypothetical protein
MCAFPHLDLGAALTALKDIVVAVVAIVTATAAVRGLRKWREELHGKAAFDVARGLIRATYRLRDELQSFRSPFVRGSEFPADYQSFAQNAPYIDAQAWAHVYKNRWEPVAVALREFDAQVLEGEALWGAQIRDRAQNLRTCAHTVFVAIESTIEDKAAGGEHFKADPGFARRMRATIAASASAPDNELSNQIARAVGDLEADLRQHLTR